MQTLAAGGGGVKLSVRKTERLLSVPDSFKETALSFPSKAEQAIALITDADDAIDILAKAEAMECIVRRIKADTETTNAISFGTILIKAKIGELMPAKPPKDRGQRRGGNKSSKAPLPDFSKPTVASFRKLGKHKPRISENRDKVNQNTIRSSRHSDQHPPARRAEWSP